MKIFGIIKRTPKFLKDTIGAFTKECLKDLSKEEYLEVKEAFIITQDQSPREQIRENYNLSWLGENLATGVMYLMMWFYGYKARRFEKKYPEELL